MNLKYLTFLTTITFLVDAIKSSDLQVTIGSSIKSFAKTDDLQITVQYKNKGQNDLLIDKWFLRDGDLRDPTFQVFLDNSLVDYIGPLYKRKPPTKEDSFRLRPGENVDVNVKISSTYDLTRSGDYSIQFKFPVSRLIVDSSSTSGKLPFDSNSDLTSNSIDVLIEGRIHDRQKPDTVHNRKPRASSISYTSCSSAQESLLVTATGSATTYAQKAFIYLRDTTPSGTNRYRTWFGTFYSTRWNTVKAHFRKIRDAFVVQALSYDCSCTDTGVYAYVYPNSPYTIYLCGYFWQTTNTGTDSRAGTLIHEMSHFTVVSGTSDHAYGQSACRSLASSNPTKAINNADSHEYFAENTPVLT